VSLDFIERSLFLDESVLACFLLVSFFFEGEPVGLLIITLLLIFLVVNYGALFHRVGVNPELVFCFEGSAIVRVGFIK